MDRCVGVCVPAVHSTLYRAPTFFRALFCSLLKVTDGWYPVDASLDEALAHFLRRGKIVPGTKLSLSNAALEAGGGAPSSGADGGGSVAGVDPLELLRKRSVGELPPGAGPRLRLVVNSTRRARWDARLGFFRPKRELPQGRGGGGQGSGGGSCKRAGASCEGPAEARGEQSPLEVPLCTVVPGERLSSDLMRVNRSLEACDVCSGRGESADLLFSRQNCCQKYVIPLLSPCRKFVLFGEPDSPRSTYSSTLVCNVHPTPRQFLVPVLISRSLATNLSR